MEKNGNVSTKISVCCKKYLTIVDKISIMIMQISRWIRKVDELGRIVLPIELRRTLDIAERDELEIYMESDRIILQKFEPACVFCGSSRGLISYRQKNICQECIRNMTEF